MKKQAQRIAPELHENLTPEQVQCRTNVFVVLSNLSRSQANFATVRGYAVHNVEGIQRYFVVI